MECVLVDMQKYTALKGMVDQSAKAYAAATSLIDALNHAFAGTNSALGAGALKITPIALESFEFSVTSGVTQGRLTYEAEIIEGAYVGALTLWKRSFNAEGARIWTKAWKVYLPTNDSPYYFDGRQRQALEIIGPRGDKTIVTIGTTFIVRLMEE